MDAITYSAARAHLASVMEETAYLLRSRANVRRFHKAVAELNTGKATERALVP